MNRKTILIIAGVAALLCVGLVVLAIAGGVIGGLALTQPATSTGDAFMTALKDGHYDQAYTLCSDSLQQEVGSVQRLEELIQNGNVQPTKWSFTSRNTSGDQAELTGSVTFTGERNGTVQLVLEKVGSEWRVSGFHLKEE